MISKGFYEYLEAIAEERRLEKSDVLAAVEIALIKAVQAEGHTGIIEVEFNDELKKVRITETFNVVEEINPELELEGQITLEQAKEIRARVRIGSVIKKEIPFSEIGRKGATRFKTTFIQNLKELGYKRAYEYFVSKEGEVVTAIVEKATDKVVILNLGMNTQSIMPVEEALTGETYVPGKQIKVTITKVEETTKSPKVYVSRSNKEIIKRLFELYIPEISQGVIEVIGIVREPGSRSKIGIKSNNINVDAKGACVGVGGARIKQINQALNGERIDIFEWNDNPILLIAEALTPAKVISVLIDEDTHKAIVIVPDEQFSLAIGKGGQNVRLASQVTGWKIDIKDETTAYREEIRFKPNVYTA
ncbi:MAG: transcription termination/antitermination protein NusA [Bacilli bacterium]|jgi:N utilization substance protein A|nr:transcription termination/antitermination protein NusA [Bacilli bacterium]